jgi:hypothetical protein
MIDYENKVCPFKDLYCTRRRCAAWTLVNNDLYREREGCILIEGKE